MTSIWKRLDLARTRDRGEIRRAYARVLKVTNPEDDPEGFQHLRQAYEAALRYADAGYDYEDDYDDHDQDADSETLTDGGGDDGADDEGWSPDPGRDALRELRDQRRAERSAEAEAIEREARARAQSLYAARRRLTLLLEGEADPDPEALAEALDRLLTSDGLEDLGAYTETEAWLSRQIAWSFPRTDPLVDRAIERFDWRDRAGSLASSHEIERILTREKDLRFLRQIQLPKHPQNPTWRVLVAGPGGSPLHRLRVAWMHKAVHELLESLQHRHPTVVDTLDNSVLDGWHDYFDRPRIGPISMIAAVVAPLFVAWVAGVAAEGVGPMQRVLSGLAGFGGAFGAIVGGMAIKHFAFDRPRHLWQTRWSWRAPAWAKGGWAGLSFLSILVIAALPGHVAGVILSGGLAAVVLLWSFTVAEHDSHSELATRLGAVAFTNLALVLLWIGLMSEGRSGLAIAQASLVVLASGVAFARAPVTLSEAWFELTSERMRMGATFLACGSAAFLAVLMVASGQEGSVPPMLLAGLAACLSLAQRVPALRAGDGERNVRYYGTLALGVVAVLFGGSAGLSAPAIAGVILAGGSALSLLVTLIGQARGR